MVWALAALKRRTIHPLAEYNLAVNNICDRLFELARDLTAADLSAPAAAHRLHRFCNEVLSQTKR